MDPNEFDDDGGWGDEVGEEEQTGDDGFVEVGGGGIDFDASKHILKKEEDAIKKRTNASLQEQGWS